MHLRLYIALALSALSVVVHAHNTAESRLEYTENLGQWEEQIRYRVDLSGGWAFLEDTAVTFLFYEPEAFLHTYELNNDNTRSPGKHFSHKRSAVAAHAYKLKWTGARRPQLSAAEAYSHYTNYYMGADKQRWKSGVRSYRSVIYGGLYDKIDLKVYSEAGSMKSDYIVRKGGNPFSIKMVYDGVDRLEIQPNGFLKIQTSVNEVYEYKPYAYQDIRGIRREVACSYVLRGNELSFELPEGYDPAFDLVIDPTLIFSTYSGSPSDNWGASATYDNDGNMYLGGIALGVAYPVTTGAFQEWYAGGYCDVVIKKISADGSTRMFSTYLGGSDADILASLYHTDQDEIIALVSTGSVDYPVSDNAYQAGFAGGTGFYAFGGGIYYFNGADFAITKLNSEGTRLVGSTYFGGADNDGVNIKDDLLFNYGDESRSDIAVDRQGNIYVAGVTNSSNIKGTRGRLQPAIGGGSDGLVFKMSSDLSQLHWATYYGGSSNDGAYGIRLDAEENILICGGTNSANLPGTASGLNPAYSGGTDGFVTKISNDGNRIINSTYLGTDQYDQGYLLELDAEDNVLILGQTLGEYPVTPGVYNNPFASQFIHKLNKNLDRTIFSTVFGSSQRGLVNITPTAFLVDICGNMYAVGWGGGVNYEFQYYSGTTFGMPVTQDAYQRQTDGADFYLICLSRDASQLVYASYFGEAGWNVNRRGADHVDGGTSRFDKNGIVYQAVCASCGKTDNFPTTPGVISNHNLSSNCNMAGVKFKFDLLSMQITSIRAEPAAGCSPLTTKFTYTITQPAQTFFWDFGDGQTSTKELPVHTYEKAGEYLVIFKAFNPLNCNVVDSSTFTIMVSESQSTDLARNICNGDTLTVGDSTFTRPGTYTIPYKNSWGCDSIVTLNLEVYPAYADTIEARICEGESYVFGGDTLRNQGVYPFRYQTIHGCDSSYTIVLQVISRISDTLSVKICAGSTFFFGGDTLMLPGDYVKVFRNQYGCDSTVMLVLSIVQSFSDSVRTTLCFGETYTLGNEVLSQPGVYTRKFLSQAGCDSTVYLELDFYPEFRSAVNAVICSGEGYIFGPDTLRQSGTYTDTLLHSSGCDSTVVLQLTVHPEYRDSLTAQVCMGGYYELGGQVITSPGEYTWQGTSAAGCDSSVYVNITFTDLYRDSLEAYMCEGEPYYYRGERYDQAGTYDINVTGDLCDTLIHLVIIGVPNPSVTIEASATTVTPGQEVTLKALSDKGVQYFWTPEQKVSHPYDSVTTAIIESNTLFKITVKDELGCAESDSIWIILQSELCTGNEIFIPTAFSPNADGKNDIFFVRTIVPLSDIRFMIFNRWGEKVFETNDLTAGWDGMYKGKSAEAGAYSYHFKARCEETIIERKGNLTVIR